jgi:cysteine desulfurase/selenocysteine lyase
MIKDVSFEKTTYAELPHKFEAGTPNIAGGIALGTAVDYMNEVGFDNIQQQENELLAYGTARLLEIEGLKIYGTAAEKTSVISFNIEGIHPDIGTIIDKLGIAVREVIIVLQPIMTFFDILWTIRASFAFYNTKEEIDLMVAAVKKKHK